MLCLLHITRVLPFSLILVAPPLLLFVVRLHLAPSCSTFILYCALHGRVTPALYGFSHALPLSLSCGCASWLLFEVVPRADTLHLRALHSSLFFRDSAAWLPLAARTALASLLMVAISFVGYTLYVSRLPCHVVLWSLHIIIFSFILVLLFHPRGSN